MKLDARIFFRTTYRDRRGRPCESVFYEPIETDVPELSSAEAPVATMTARGPLTRWYDARHFAERPNPDGLTIADIREILEWHALHGMTYGYDCFEYETRSSLYPPTDVASHDDGPRNRALEMATTCFDRVVMIDGSFWVECAEPYLYRETPGHDPRLLIDFPTPKHQDRPNHRSHSWLFHSRVTRADDPAAADHVTVLIPESIRSQPEREAILDAARFLIEDYSYTYLSNTHPEIMQALTTLHGAIYGIEPADVDCDTIVDPIYAMVDAMERRETDARLGDRTRLAAYRQCADGWTDRDVSVCDVLPRTAKPPGL